jgi:hypothetical protein
LKRSNYAEVNHLFCRKVRYVLAFKKNLSARGKKELRQQIKERSFSRSVRPNHCMETACRHSKIDVIDRNESGKILREVSGFEQELALHDLVSPPKIF